MSFRVSFLSDGDGTTTYRSMTLDYLSGQNLFVKDSAMMLGVSATAIAGAMAEEADSYFARMWRDDALDLFARSSITTISAAGMDFWPALLAGPEAVDLWKQFYAEELQTTRSHDEWEAAYAAANGDTDSSLYQKVLNPVLMDVGSANFKVWTAIRLVKDHAASEPALGLTMYERDFSSLVADLINPASNLTAKLYGVYIKEAEAWFQSKSAYGSDWLAVPQEFKDALYVTYTNLGQAKMEELWGIRTNGGVHPYNPMPALGTGGGISHLTNAEQIATSIGGNVGYGTGIKFLSQTVSSIVWAAKADDAEGLAWRYALSQLRYVAFEGIAPNGSGELDLYNPEAGSGQITDSWIQARSEMLNWKRTFDTRDDSYNDRLNSLGGLLPTPVEGDHIYEDVATGLTLDIDGVNPAALASHFIRFGNYADNVLNGAGLEDRLYGAAGSDTLNGEAGHDYLEGGAGDDHLYGGNGSDTLLGMADNDHLYGGNGNDILDGGAGNDILDGGSGSDILKGGAGEDTYIIDGSAGNDTIIDPAGGVIKYKGHVLSGGKAVSAGAQQWRDNHVTYSLVSEHGFQHLVITVGANTVKVLDWQPDKFGIQLEGFDDPEPISVDQVIEGDQKPIDFDPAEEGVQVHYDELGNVIVHPGLAEPGRNDSLYDSAGDDELYGYSGDDNLDAWRGGNDLLDGGTGNDRLSAGAGQDTLIGGEGSDRLSGQDGDDRLYADGQLTDEQAFAANDLDNGLAQRGDLLDGEAGKDFLVGGRGQDLLLGGSGQDLLFGGAGDDVLYGDDGVLWDSADWGLERLVEYDESEDITRYIVLYSDMWAALRKETGQDGDFLYGGAGDDWLFGQHGQDYLNGGPGNDVLFGGRDSDFLVGGDGDDTLAGDDGITPTGQDGDDYLDGGKGNDSLWGDGGHDILYGGEGDDVLSGDNRKIDPSLHGDDYLDGGEGNDTLWGDGGSDTLLGSAGDDLLTGDAADLAGQHHGNDSLHGGSGNDTLFGLGGDDLLHGDDGDDRLIGDASESDLAGQYHGRDTLHGGAGNDTLYGGGGDDVLHGGADDDELVGDDDISRLDSQHHGNDQLHGGAGHDRLWGNGGNDTLWGGEDNDYLQGDSANLPEELHGDDRLYGGTGNDTLFGDGGDDALDGGEGDDQLLGGDGDDRLIGGSGFDYLSGGAGDDTYVFNLGDSHLSAQGHAESIQDNMGSNSLEFGVGISVDEIQLSQYSGMLRLRYSAEDSLLLLDGLAGGVQWARFADGSSFTLEELYARNSQDAADWSSQEAGGHLLGSATGNQLTGSGGGSTFRGGRGDDTLVGAGGGNLYLYERGDGIDHIHDTGGHLLPDGTPATNRVRFGAGIHIGDLSLAPGEEGTLEILIAGDPPGKLILHNFDANDAANSCAIGFFDFADGTSLSYADLLGSGFLLVGSAADDSLLGSNLPDVLLGNAGNDTLVAGAEDDTLDGGVGDDVLVGGAGADLYLYTRGQGNDTIVEVDDGSINTLRIAPGLAPDDVELGADAAQNLLLKIASTGETLVLANWLSSGSALVQRIEFADGTLWTEEWIRQNLRVQVGTEENDVLTALAGQSATLYGLAGNDTLNGNVGDDLLVGGTGNDQLHGGSGNDRYLLGLGDGQDVIHETSGFDVLEFSADVSPEDISLSRVGDDLVLAHVNGSDAVMLRGWYAHTDDSARVEEVRFSGGLAWTGEQLTQWGLVQYGGDGNDILTGVTNYADTLYGGGGNDELWGYGGDDSLVGGDGDDTLQGGDGNDTLWGGDGDDFIDAGAGDDEIYGGDGNDYILTRSGKTIVHAGAGDDWIKAETGAFIYAGLGNDNISVNSGQVTLKYSLGDGFDTHHDFARTEFSGGLGEDDFRYLRAGHNLVMLSVASDSDGIWMSSFYRSSSAGSKAENFSLLFSDGTQINDIAVSDLDGVYLDARVIATGGNWLDVLYYSTNYSPNADSLGQYTHLSGGGFFLGDSNLTDDVLIGSESADLFYVRSGDDVVYSLGGNDTIRLYDGNDTVSGGKGDDLIEIQGNGDKTILFAAGDGADRISSPWANTSVSILVEGYSADQVTFQRTGSAVMLGFAGTADSIRLGAFLNIYEDTYGSEYESFVFHFTDGETLGAQDILDGVYASETPPVAVEDILHTDMNKPLYISGYDLMANDYDAEAGAHWELYMTGVGSAVNGRVLLDAQENILFIPEPGFYGIASFTYTLSDLFAQSEGNVTVHVQKNHEVVAGGELIISASTLLAEDGVSGNETFEIVSVAGWDDLQVEYDNVSGLLRITPAPDFNGQTAFEYTLYDGEEFWTETAYLEVGTLQNLSRAGSNGADTLEGSFGNDTLNGAGGVDYLLGGKGNDRLNGGTGADVIIGGEGNDTYVVDNPGDILVEFADGGIDTVESSISFALTDHLENLLLTGSSAIHGTGNELDNKITGNGAANLLIGGSGDDRLDGKGGADTMQGGLGNDTYVVERAADVVIEHTDEGIDSIDSSITYTLGDHLENLTLTGSSAINGTGNDLDNVLIGNGGKNRLTGGAGNDRLDGKGGADTLLGGSGDDTYVVDSSSDVVTEYANEGIDTVESGVTWTLGNHLENLTLLGSASINGTGNALNNGLVGNAGANRLSGGAGDDTLDGRAGADTLTGGAGNDTYILGRGYGLDTVVENDASAGDMDMAQFLEGISTEQLWFRRASGSNSLEVSIIGTTDKLMVQDWYLGSAYRVEQFKTADGKTLLEGQVQSLVDAMAAFGVPAGGEGNLGAEQKLQLETVIAANWQ